MIIIFMMIMLAITLRYIFHIPPHSVAPLKTNLQDGDVGSFPTCVQHQLQEFACLKLQGDGVFFWGFKMIPKAPLKENLRLVLGMSFCFGGLTKVLRDKGGNSNDEGERTRMMARTTTNNEMIMLITKLNKNDHNNNNNTVRKRR